MNFHDKVRKIWKDPVISKVIAAGITFALGGLFFLLSNLNWNEEIKDPCFWVISLISLIVLGIFIYYILNYIILRDEIKAELSSEKIEDNTIMENDIENVNESIKDNPEETAIANEEELHKPYNWLDSDILFSECIAQTFPGDRDIVWYDSSVAVQRLNLFFENIRKQEPTGDAVWWRRGNQAFSVKDAEILDVDKIFLGNDRFKISRIAVFVSPSYYKHFIYVEADAESPTGLHPEITATYIENGKERRGYVHEEYGEFNGRLISREEYDDGASVYENIVVQHNGEAKLRVRYLTKVNFVLTPKNSPYNNKKFDRGSAELFNDALYSGKNIHKLFEFMDTFQKSDMPGSRYE